MKQQNQQQKNGFNRQNSHNLKRQKSVKYSLKDYFKQYYLKDFHRVVHSTYRPLGLALILMAIQNLQFISLFFSEETVTYISNYDQLMYGIQQVFDQFKGWTLLSTIFNLQRPWENIILFQSALNSSILVIVIMGIIYSGFRRNKNLNSSIQVDKSNMDVFFRLSEVYTSFLISIYPFILHMPFQHSNLKVCFNSEISDQLYKVLAFANIPSTLLIGIIGLVHDFSYSYKPKDSLAGEENLMGISNFISEFILCLLTQAEVTWGLWAAFIVIHYQLIFYILNLPFYNPLISKVYFSFTLSKWILWFTNILFEIKSVRDHFNMGFILVGCIPLLWKIPHYLYQARINHILLGQSCQELNKKTIELYCRNLARFVDLDQYEYMKGAKGMTFEMKYLDHISYCSQKQCFCNEFKNITDQISFSSAIQLFDQKKRFEFQCFLIIETYSEFFRKNARQIHKYQKLQYSYLHFIIEIMHIPTKSFVEVVSIRNILKMNSASLKQQFIIESLMRLANTEFSTFWEKSEIQNQRLDMMSVIDFSDLNSQIARNIKQILITKKDLLLFLNTDYIDLNQLVSKGKSFVHHRDQLERQILDIFDINPYSKQLYFYAEIYCENFDIRQRKLRHFIKNSKLKLLKQLRKEDMGINIFRQKSCMVYITLLNPIGLIKRVSTSFEQLFGVKADDAVGKSCNFMMPDVIAGIHDDFLKYFVQRGNLHNLKKGIIFGFGKRKNGFMFAIHARTKLILDKLNDFGVAGYFEEVNPDYDYFLCDPSGCVLDITERIYAYCFYNLWKLDKKKIENLDVCKLIPLLAYQILKEQKNTQYVHYQTLMCIPITNQMMNNFRKQNKFDPVAEIGSLMSRFKQYDQFIFLEVNVRYEQIDTAIGASVKFVEITRFRRIRKEQEIIENLNLLKQDLSKYLDIPITVIYQPQDQQLNQIQTINSQKQQQQDEKQSLSKTRSRIDSDLKIERKFKDDDNKIEATTENRNQKSRQPSILDTKKSLTDEPQVRTNLINIENKIKMHQIRQPIQYQNIIQLNDSQIRDKNYSCDSIQPQISQLKLDQLLNGYDQLLSTRNEFDTDRFNPKDYFLTNRDTQQALEFSRHEDLFQSERNILEVQNNDGILKALKESEQKQNIYEDILSNKKRLLNNLAPIIHENFEEENFSQTVVDKEQILKIGLDDFSKRNLSLQQEAEMFDWNNNQDNPTYINDDKSEIRIKRDDNSYIKTNKTNNDLKYEDCNQYSANRYQYFEQDTSNNKINNTNLIENISILNPESNKTCYDQQMQFDVYNSFSQINHINNRITPAVPDYSNTFSQFLTDNQQIQTISKENKQKKIENSLQNQILVKQVSDQNFNSLQDPLSVQNSSHLICIPRAQKQTVSTNISSLVHSNLANSIDNKGYNNQGEDGQITSSLIINNSKSQLSLEFANKISQQNYYSKGIQKKENGSEYSKYSKRNKNIKHISARQNDLFDDENEIDDNRLSKTFKNSKEDLRKQNDSVSIRSSNNDLHSRKQAVVEEIMQKKPPKFAAILINLGKIAGQFVLMMCIVLFIVYHKQMNILYDNNENEKSISVFANNYLKIINNLELIRLIEGFDIDESKQYGFSKSKLQNESLEHLSEFKQFMSEYSQQSDSVGGLKFFNEQTIETILIREYPYSNMIQNKTQSLTTNLNSFVYYAYAYINDYQNNPTVQGPIYSNFIQQINNLKQYYQESQEDMNFLINGLSLNLSILFIITCIISFFSITIILPINYSVEKKKEDLLKLMCTFPPEKLISYLQNTELAIRLTNNNQLHLMENQTNRKQEQFLQNSKAGDTLFVNQLIPSYNYKSKKKTISQTSQLKKMNFQSLLLAIFTFFLLLLQPSLIFTITTEYIKRIQDNLSMVKIFTNDNLHMSQLYSSSFLQANFRKILQDQKSLEKYPTYLYSNFQKFYTDLIYQSEQVSSQMYQIQQQIQESKSLDNTSKSSFIQLIKEDICAISPVYLNQLNILENYDGFTPCDTELYKPSLQKGIILTQNKLHSIFKNLLQVFQIKEYTEFKDAILQNNDQNSFSQMIIAQENLDLSINIISTIIYSKITEQIEYLKRLNIILFVFQLLIVIFVYSFLWESILNKIRSNFFSVKYLLTFFSIDQILENSYISNYLQKSNKQTKHY